MKRQHHKKEPGVMGKKLKVTMGSISEGSFLKNLPLPLFAKEGYISSLWQREGRRDFINQCLHPYDRISKRQFPGFVSTHLTHGGFTLIELMISLVISMVIIGAIYGSYISQQRSFVAQDQVAEMNSTSKIALDMMVNDIRESGFGLPEDLSTIQRTAGCSGINGFTRKITSTDSSTAEDTITLLGGFRKIGNLAAAVSAGSTTLTLTATDLLKDGGTFQADRGYISIGGVSFAIVTAISGNTLTLHASTPVDKTFSVFANVPVYLVENVTYQVAGGQLQRVRRLDDSGSGSCNTAPDDPPDVIAENIEDFQIAYGVDTDSDGVINQFRNAPLASDSLLRIRLNLLASTAPTRGDPNFKGQGNPPALIENRSHSSTDDGLRRRLWQMEVALRNAIL